MVEVASNGVNGGPSDAAAGGFNGGGAGGIGALTGGVRGRRRIGPAHLTAYRSRFAFHSSDHGCGRRWRRRRHRSTYAGGSAGAPGEPALFGGQPGTSTAGGEGGDDAGACPGGDGMLGTGGAGRGGNGGGGGGGAGLWRWRRRGRSRHDLRNRRRGRRPSGQTCGRDQHAGHARQHGTAADQITYMPRLRAGRRHALAARPGQDRPARIRPQLRARQVPALPARRIGCRPRRPGDTGLLPALEPATVRSPSRGGARAGGHDAAYGPPANLGVGAASGRARGRPVHAAQPPPPARTPSVHGRLGGRALAPGAYRLSGVPTDAARNRGRAFSRALHGRALSRLRASMARRIVTLPGDGIGPRSWLRPSTCWAAWATSSSRSTRSAAPRSTPTGPP